MQTINYIILYLKMEVIDNMDEKNDSNKVEYTLYSSVKLHCSLLGCTYMHTLALSLLGHAILRHEIFLLNTIYNMHEHAHIVYSLNCLTVFHVSPLACR